MNAIHILSKLSGHKRGELLFTIHFRVRIQGTCKDVLAISLYSRPSITLHQPNHKIMGIEASEVLETVLTGQTGLKI